MAQADPAVVGGAVAVPGPAAELSGPVHDPAWDDPERLEPRDLTGEERAAFVEYIRGHTGCSNQEACKAVGVRRKDVRALLKADKEFEEDYKTARGYGQEQILNAMVRLGLEGVEEPLVSAGKLVKDDDGQVVTVRRHSDRLVQTMFNAMTPEGKSMMAGKLGIEISGPDGGPIQVQRGISLVEALEWARAHGVPLPLSEPEVAGELVAETDEPAE